MEEAEEAKAEEEEVEEGSIGDEDEGEDSCSTLIFLKALSAAKQIRARIFCNGQTVGPSINDVMH